MKSGKVPSSTSPLRGRCIAIEPEPGQAIAALIRNEAGHHVVHLANTDAIQIGDIVEVQEDQARVLTPNRSPKRTQNWIARTLDPRRLRAIQVRNRVEAVIREHFLRQDFHETRTPLLVPCPGMEPHIRPFRLESGSYLPTSPEFAMKRLLVGGLERIFQICSSFRLEPFSRTHHPEFTMLEWYRAYAGYETLMTDTEELFAGIALKISGKTSLTFQGQEIDLTPPWPRLHVRDLFRDLAGVDLVQSCTADRLATECKRLGLSPDPGDTWDDLYFRIWLNFIEPRLPADRAVIVMRYPASQAALAVVEEDPDGTRWAKRFEVYAGGLELGNAFEELTDPVEQRKRFIEDMALRERVYGPSFRKNPMDEEFLGALEEGMPPSAGIAMGVDRIAMLFADEPDIEKTLWLPSDRGLVSE